MMIAVEKFINDLCSHLYGIKPIRMKRMAFGHCNVVYEVRVGERALIVRTNEDPAVLKGTASNMNQLAALGLPVPDMIDMDLSMQEYPFAYMILRKIPGRDLRYELPHMTTAQMTAVAEHIVSFQNLAGKLPHGTGYGWVSIGEKGPFSSWFEVVQRDLESHIHQVKNDLSAAAIQVLYSQFDALQLYLEQIEPVCFLDDITIKNVIVENGVLQGLIDFDWVCYGDPLYMIALTQTAIISDISDEKALFYIEELCRIMEINEQQRDIVNWYSVIHGLRFLEHQRKENHDDCVKRVVAFMQKVIGSNN
jgi:aminoglycoside phosphotransferase (APT) family kinase protein